MTFPTQLTVLRIVLVPVFYILFAVVDPAQAAWATLVFFVAGISDWYDGYFARAFNSVTSFGAFLDPLADKLLTSAAFVAFASRGLIPWWMVALVLGRDIYLTILRLIADSLRLKLTTTYLAKVKTFIQMLFILVVLLSFSAIELHLTRLSAVATAILSGDALYWSMAAVTVLTTFSAIDYSYANWATLRAFAVRYFPARSSEKL